MYFFASSLSCFFRICQRPRQSIPNAARDRDRGGGGDPGKAAAAHLEQLLDVLGHGVVLGGALDALPCVPVRDMVSLGPPAP